MVVRAFGGIFCKGVAVVRCLRAPCTLQGDTVPLTPSLNGCKGWQPFVWGVGNNVPHKLNAVFMQVLRQKVAKS